jgi:hypothetical protein
MHHSYTRYYNKENDSYSIKPGDTSKEESYSLNPGDTRNYCKDDSYSTMQSQVIPGVIAKRKATV